MLHAAESLIALSESVVTACHAWYMRFGGKGKIVRIDHPGLFVSSSKLKTEYLRYALVCGISRPKKSRATGSIPTLLDLCHREGVRVWEHWANLKSSEPVPPAWRQTYGVVGDAKWSNMISHAQVVLCPYRTRIQSVSGLISEALSARRFILSTSFDLALEMKARVPSLVTIKDDIRRWPALIQSLPQACKHIDPGIPTWNLFARSLASELAEPESRDYPTAPL